MGKIIKTVNLSVNTQETKIELHGIATGIYKVLWTDGKHIENANLIIH